MAVVQISRIQHRRGTSAELPDQLAEGEIGFTTDTGEVFIGTKAEGNLTTGASSKVSGRETYPYENIKILTEFDVQYTLTGDVYYHGPLKKHVMPGSGQILELFAIDDNVTSQFGNYDYSITTDTGCKSGQFFVSYHTVAGLSFNIPNASVTTPDPGISFTPTKMGDKIVLMFNISTVHATFAISGRQWSV